MGLRDPQDKGGVSLWARLFQSKGSIAPGHEAADFGAGGNFAFEQKSSGVEAGIDFAVGDELSLGLLLAKSEAASAWIRRAAVAAASRATASAPTRPGCRRRAFYLDASYRAMDFSATLGALDVDGKASSFNLEAATPGRCRAARSSSRSCSTPMRGSTTSRH
jgi:outer membrane autotransporter protein